jgi:hypothetical protein
MNFKIIAVCAALAAAAAGTSARAQADAQHPCKPEAQRLCGTTTDKDKVLSCLEANVAKIQDAECKSRVSDYHAQNQASKTNDANAQNPAFKAKDASVKKACAADIAKASCKGDIGSGLLDCLGKNPATLSDSCKDTFRPHPAASAKETSVKKSCAADIAKAGCPADFGSGLLTCLAKDPKDLSDTCKDEFRPSPTKKIAARNTAVVSACSSDIAAKKCSGKSITSGLVKCLTQDNNKALSIGCLTALK